MTTPWQVIEAALAHMKPPRGQKWLADQIGAEIQVVSNWKQRGRVPPSRYRDISKALGISVDQLEGLEPPPWERAAQDASWPFSDELLGRVMRLDHAGLKRLENVMRAHLEMDQVRSSGMGTIRQTDDAPMSQRPYRLRPEEQSEIGLPEHMAVQSPPTHASSKKTHRPARKGSGGRT